MTKVEKLFIKNGEIDLEAEYYQSNSNLNHVILICHPHPQFLRA